MPFFELLILFAGALAAFYGLYEVLDESNNPPEDEPVEPAVDDGAPTIEDLVLGDLTRLEGDDEDNVLTGTSDAERIEGGAGDDTITGEGGADQILAGDGNDTVTGSGQIFGEAGDDTLTATEGGSSLVGGAGDDTLTGEGDSALFGGEGNDVLIAAADGALSGGAGDDLFVAQSDEDDAGVLVVRDFNLTTDRLAFDVADGERATSISSAPLEGEEPGLTVTVTFEQQDGSGTPRTEIVQLNGVTSDAVLEGLQARDASGALSNLEQTNILNGTADADTLAGTDGNDTISAGDGNDEVSGGLGNNQVFLGAGDDTYTGGGNTDQVQGGNGNDTITDVLPTSSEAGAVRFDGGSGDDILTAVRADATLVGGFGDDTLTLGNEGGTAVGGDGADTMVGGDGADTFVLDEADTVTGGAGADTFELTADDVDTDTLVTTITDYQAGTDAISIVTPDAADVVTVETIAGTEGAPDDAQILVNGDPVARVTGAGGLTLADITVSAVTPATPPVA